MRDISKFQNLVNTLDVRVRQEYGLFVKLEIHETDEYVAAQYENREGVALFCIVQTFSKPLDRVIEKIDLFFPHCPFPKLAVFYEFFHIYIKKRTITFAYLMNKDHITKFYISINCFYIFQLQINTAMRSFGFI